MKDIFTAFIINIALKYIRLYITIIITFVLIPMSSNNLLAQDYIYGYADKTFSGAAVAGVNFSQVDGDSYYGYHKVGLNIGAQAYAHFNTTWGMSMEFLYSQKGSRGQAIVESPTIGTYVTKYFMNINYIEVPFMLHTIYHDFDIEAGVSYGFLLQSNEYILSDQPVSITIDKNSFNTTETSFIFGLSHKLYGSFFANIRYQYSLAPIRSAEKIPIGYSYGNQGQFNNLFNLRVLYYF